jgi:predicted metal-dependent hydrolase
MSEAANAAALDWTSDGFRRGAELWNRGRFWEAHEAWEAPWRAAGRHTAAGRFLQGLILLAAAGVKRQDGAQAVARRLAARGARRLEGAHAVPGFDASAFAAEVERWVEGALAAPPRLARG